MEDADIIDYAAIQYDWLKNELEECDATYCLDAVFYRVELL